MNLPLRVLLLCAAFAIPWAASAKSAKRGIAYDLAAASDLHALSHGVSWWYDWGSTPNPGVPPNYLAQYHMDYYPMLWNGNFDPGTIVAFLKANPKIRYLLVLNEPNVQGQAYLTPQQAAPNLAILRSRGEAGEGENRRSANHLGHHAQL